MKKLFVDDVDSLEVLLAHSLPEGVANLMIPVAVILALFVVDWKLALLSLASIPLSLWAMKTMYAVGMQKMGPYYAAGQKMNNTIIEYVNGMEVVKVFNRDADSYARLRDDVLAYRDYTLAWYKAAWPWMAMYSSLLPCTIILTLPVGSWFVLRGWSTLADHPHALSGAFDRYAAVEIPQLSADAAAAELQDRCARAGAGGGAACADRG